jgi:ABC-type nitrate/sulfonate/bicarbonate transport system ATPase subunit
VATGPEVSVDLAGMRFPGAPAALFGPLRLEVAAGEVVALIGASGAGKTTLLRIIAGLENGFDGRVVIGGVAAERAPAPGYVFQDARLLPWLDAAGNIGVARQGIGAEEVAALLRKVGLEGMERSYPHQLSGGMQRRLGLARALAVGSGLLLLDEPFVSLDRAVVEDLRRLFRRVAGEGHLTIILVSHDPEDAAELADRAILLEGRPARITADYRPPAGRV